MKQRTHGVREMHTQHKAHPTNREWESRTTPHFAQRLETADFFNKDADETRDVGSIGATPLGGADMEGVAPEDMKCRATDDVV